MELLAQAEEMTPEEVASLLLKVRELEAQVEDKDAFIRWLQAQVFGPKSERRLLEELAPQEQLWLGEQMLEPTENPPPPEVTVAAYERKQRGQVLQVLRILLKKETFLVAELIISMLWKVIGPSHFPSVQMLRRSGRQGVQAL